MRLGRLVLFIESEPDLLLTPNTELGLINVSEVKTVLVDPGVPNKGETVATRFKKLALLIKETINLGIEKLYVVSVDVWEPRLNVKLFRQTMSRLRELRIPVDYEVILYIHGYKTNNELYSGVLNDGYDGVIIGITTLMNTLSYPRVVRCSEDFNYCAKDIEYALNAFSKVHFGGTGVKALRAISNALNNPLNNTNHLTWLSADTMATRWRYDKSLAYKYVCKGSKLLATQHREYVNAFLKKISTLNF
jgi:hypothetical protein|nr:MAG: hypothetical protein TU35_06860 [Thermoproteus sp. AZ2]